MSEPFIAEVRIFGFHFAPRGWAFCNGQLLPISQNTALFSLVGTTYGGDGKTTFALPNLQGRASMHPGRGPGLTARRLGENGGSETVTLTTMQMPSHSHALTGSDERGDATSPQNNYLGTGTDMYAPEPPGSTLSPPALPPAGGNQPHNNIQPSLSLNYCIALVGLYPSRG